MIFVVFFFFHALCHILRHIETHPFIKIALWGCLLLLSLPVDSKKSPSRQHRRCFSGRKFSNCDSIDDDHKYPRYRFCKCQTIELAEADEIVRITAPNIRTAEALEQIAHKIRSAKIEIPLVAASTFTIRRDGSSQHVEKVRINPGNYADRKRFKARSLPTLNMKKNWNAYTMISPLVLRCKELGRAMRSGTNHGSLRSNNESFWRFATVWPNPLLNSFMLNP